MITIDTKAYLLRMFVGNFFFFLLFYMTNTDLNKRKYLFVCLLIPLTFFVELFTDVSAESSPQSCVKVQPHQKHNVLRCEPNCHAFLSEERGQEQ
ncbi:hypothetical protein LXF25_06575 [Enterococcus faecium]|uniref:hypothetical protein n=1 Tax=Enterococcus faecium TaxID=1352 RepID=UPI001E287F5E|nr:hypothetical protein [Enterococcus faecium]MCE3072449.1 hypothetical protein [Enterococcus faecium]MCE3104328.1 hypothetical protein [Enterococcus faecium]MCE3149084.1 hypothetical protein [Enterococcus faecium]MCE3159759.1 hypothetical protein [Enterococcus faecium]MCE3162672.1 hypothetical protein [Enterococcus faecium]